MARATIRAFGSVRRDPYQVLGLQRGAATLEDVQAAYRRRALKLHPDQGGDRAAFAELSAAYEALSSAHGRSGRDELDAASVLAQTFSSNPLFRGAAEKMREHDAAAATAAAGSSWETSSEHEARCPLSGNTEITRTTCAVAFDDGESTPVYRVSLIVRAASGSSQQEAEEQVTEHYADEDGVERIRMTRDTLSPRTRLARRLRGVAGAPEYDSGSDVARGLAEFGVVAMIKLGLTRG